MRRPAVLLLALAVLCAPRLAAAANKTWDGGGANTNWSTTTNWSGDTVPTVADDVFFVDLATESEEAVNIDGNVTVKSVTFQSGFDNTTGATFTIAATKRLTVRGNFTINAGAILAFPSMDRLTVTGGTFTFAGSEFKHTAGEVLLIAGSAQTHAFGGATFNDLVIKGPVGPATTNLVGHWKLDEATNIDASDSSGNGTTLTRVGANAQASAAPLLFTNSYARDFVSASNHSLNVASTPAHLKPSTWTLSAWVKPTSLDTLGSDIINNSNDFALGLNTDNTARVELRNAGATWATCNSTDTFTLSTWNHVAGINDGQKLTVYLNGVARVCSNYSGSQQYDATEPGFFIGHHPADDQFSFNGTIDDVRVYNTVLSSEDILQLGYGAGVSGGTVTHTASAGLTVNGALTISSGATLTLQNRLYVDGALTVDGTLNGVAGYPIYTHTLTKGASGAFNPSTGTVVYSGPTDASISHAAFGTLRVEDPTETNLVAYWKLDEAAGPTVWDWSGNGNHGTLEDGPTFVTSNLPTAIDFNNPAGLSFDGTDDGVQIPVSYHDPITISLWIYRTANGGSSPRMVSLPYIRFYLQSTTNKLGLYVDRNDATGTDGNWLSVETFSGDYVTPVWHHVAVTYDDSTDGHTPVFYVDGVQLTTAAGTAPAGARKSSGTGYISGLGTTSSVVAGRIDDVRIYNTALSLAQIKALAAGGYAGTGGTATYTLGAATTASGALAVDNGALATSTYDLTVTGAGTVGTGVLTLGGATSTTASFSGGLTVLGPGTLTMNAAGATAIAIGNGQTFLIDGTLTASTTGLSRTIRAVAPASNSFAFQVGSSSTSVPVLNVDTLAIQDTDARGLEINQALGVSTSATTTFTKFDNVAFSSGTSGTMVSPSYYLQITAASLGLYSNGLSFDNTTYKTFRLADTNAGSDTTAFVGGTCNSSEASCEATDEDDDAGEDGVADSGGGVIQWGHRGWTDAPGTLVGFPASAFDWDTFAFYATYAAFNNGSSDKLYLRDTDGKPVSSWTLPNASTEDFVGGPRWAYTGSGGSKTFYVFVLTTKGYVYKLQHIDGAPSNDPAGDSFSQVASYQDTGAHVTATSPLLSDTSNLYWAGNKGSSASTPQIYSIKQSDLTLNDFESAPVAVNALPTVGVVGGTNYLFAATLGKFYRMSTSMDATVTSVAVVPALAVSGRVTATSGKAYFIDDGGKVWVADITQNPPTLAWYYQDTTIGANNHTVTACPTNVGCAAKSLFVAGATGRVYFGDYDGHVYAVANGAVIYANYPLKPSGITGHFTTAPLYRDGVIVIGASDGMVYFLDQYDGTDGGEFYKTFNFGPSAISTISYDRNSASAGEYMIGTADGKLYYISEVTVDDPTPGSI